MFISFLSLFEQVLTQSYITIIVVLVSYHLYIKCGMWISGIWVHLHLKNTLLEKIMSTI